MSEFSESTKRVILRLAVTNINNTETKLQLIEKYRASAGKRNSENAYSKDFNAGFDLFVPQEITFDSSKDHKVCINFGIQAYMVEINTRTGEETPLCYWMVPRSSVGSKTPLRMANSLGVIDSGYRGELKGYFDNMDAYRNSNDVKFEIKPFDRFVQIVGPRMDRFDVEVVDSISIDTDRGDRGDLDHLEDN